MTLTREPPTPPATGPAGSDRNGHDDPDRRVAGATHRVRGARWVACALAVIAFGMSLLVGAHLFPHLSLNNDEAVYVLEAQQLESGHLTLSASDHGDAFRPWMSGRTGENRLVLVEQPVLPAILAATDAMFGSMRVGLALVAAGAVLAVFAATRQLLRDDRIAIAAAALFVASPLVIVQSALFLSYLLAVLLALLVITFVSRGLESHRRVEFLAAGLLFGLLFFTRPIESLVLGVCVLVWMAAERVGTRPAVRHVVSMATGAVPVILLCLAYNAATTGNPVRFPLWAIGGNDRFGFGTRRIADGAPPVRFGPSEAWLALRTNLRAFPHWFVGGLVMVPLVAWGAVCLWRSGRRGVLALFAAIAVGFPLGYFFYWGNYLIIAGRLFFGPHYYLALLIPATSLVAVAVVDLIGRRAVVTVALVVLLVAGTAIELRDKLDANVSVRDGVARELDAVHRAVHSPAVVVVPDGADGAYVLHPRGELANPPDLRASILYAADLGGRNDELFDRFPDRTIYRLQVVNDFFGGHPDVRPLNRLHARSFDVVAQVTPPAADPVATAHVTVNGTTASCTLGSASSGRPLVARFHLTVSSVEVTGCAAGTAEVLLPPGAPTAAVGVASGPDPSPTHGEAVEQRYWMRVGGDGIDLVTPADTWWSPHGDPPTVVERDAIGWVHFEPVTPTGL